MIELIFFHPGDLSLSDFFWIFLNCLVILFPFGLGLFSIIIHYRKKKIENDRII